MTLAELELIVEAQKERIDILESQLPKPKAPTKFYDLEYTKEGARATKIECCWTEEQKKKGLARLRGKGYKKITIEENLRNK